MSADRRIDTNSANGLKMESIKNGSRVFLITHSRCARNKWNYVKVAKTRETKLVFRAKKTAQQKKREIEKIAEVENIRKIAKCTWRRAHARRHGHTMVPHACVGDTGSEAL